MLIAWLLACKIADLLKVQCQYNWSLDKPTILHCQSIQGSPFCPEALTKFHVTALVRAWRMPGRSYRQADPTPIISLPSSFKPASKNSIQHCQLAWFISSWCTGAFLHPWALIRSSGPPHHLDDQPWSMFPENCTYLHGVTGHQSRAFLLNCGPIQGRQKIIKKESRFQLNSPPDE